jgi:hypothetical protein
MKMINYALVAMMLGMMPVMADEVPVDTQIEEILEAPAQERHMLMNRFKEQVRLMNEEDRANAIEKLQTRMQQQTRTQIRINDGEGDMTRTQDRQQLRDMQGEGQMQQMQQQQMLQMQQQSPRGGGSTPMPRR